MAKTKQEGKLKQYTRQYRRKLFGEYMFIEAHTVNFNFVKGSGWAPKDEDIPMLMGYHSKEGTSICYGCVYSKADKCYYVVDCLWVPMLMETGTAEMKRYMAEVFSNMLTTIYKETVATNTKVYPGSLPQAELFEDKAEEAVKEIIKVTELPAQEYKEPEEKKSSLIDKIKIEIADDEFRKQWGMSRQVMQDTIESGDVDVVEMEFLNVKDGVRHCHILKLTKTLWNLYQLSMSNIYNVLDEYKIITRNKYSEGWRNNIFMSEESKKHGYGFTLRDEGKDTNYPVFTPKGVIAFFYALYNAGMLKKPIIPKIIESEPLTIA